MQLIERSISSCGSELRMDIKGKAVVQLLTMGKLCRRMQAKEEEAK